MGNTEVLCAASVEGRVPPFLRNSGMGWVTAEHGVLPRRRTRAASTCRAIHIDDLTRLKVHDDRAEVPLYRPRPFVNTDRMGVQGNRVNA